MNLKLLFFIGIFNISTTLFAGSLSAEDQEALKKTQQMLKNKQQRQSEIQKSPDAAKAHNNAIKTVGKQNEEEMYGISSKVFEELVKMTGGDANKMQALLEKAKTNPEAFYNSLTPATREAIQKLSAKSSRK